MSPDEFHLFSTYSYLFGNKRVKSKLSISRVFLMCWLFLWRLTVNRTCRACPRMFSYVDGLVLVRGWRLSEFRPTICGRTPFSLFSVLQSRDICHLKTPIRPKQNVTWPKRTHIIGNMDIMMETILPEVAIKHPKLQRWSRRIQTNESTHALELVCSEHQVVHLRSWHQLEVRWQERGECHDSDCLCMRWWRTLILPRAIGFGQ